MLTPTEVTNLAILLNIPREDAERVAELIARGIQRKYGLLAQTTGKGYLEQATANIGKGGI